MTFQGSALMIKNDHQNAKYTIIVYNLVGRVICLPIFNIQQSIQNLVLNVYQLYLEVILAALISQL